MVRREKRIVSVEAHRGDGTKKLWMNINFKGNSIGLHFECAFKAVEFCDLKRVVGKAARERIPQGC